MSAGTDGRSRPAAMHGLSGEEAGVRLQRFGPNRVETAGKVTFLGIAREELTEPMILLLLVVGVAYTVFGEFQDALTLYAIIFILVMVEIWTEYRAKKAIASLATIAAPETKVVRDGRIAGIPTEDVVPGDLLVLVPGTRIAADGRLVSSVSLRVDESSLTGESFPVEKAAGDDAYSGTLVLDGEGVLEAAATGGRTRIGEIAAQAQVVKPPRTPLQLAMKSLSRMLAVVAIFFSVAIPLAGYLQGLPLEESILTGLALAFATIPEELPIIITMTLGLGAYLLSRENFLVKRLRAAETLGNATVILTDKTGTITESRMQVVAVHPAGAREEVLSAARSAMTELSLSITDLALIEEAERLGIPAETSPILREETFGGGRKTGMVVRDRLDGPALYLIGAPEEVIARADDGDAGLQEALDAETAKGRRVIAVAHRTLARTEPGQSADDLEQHLTLDGLIAIEDPPRPGVRETITRMARAGIRTIMVTGDHPRTAAAIAGEVGIPAGAVIEGHELDALSDTRLREVVREASVYARVTPQHKHRLMEVFQALGEVVAVTGDGVNDTLALKGADIGIAMGVKGTDAAKEAADIVLADDNFVTVGRGILEGRRIFDNLTKGVRYYLSVKLALVAVFIASLLLALPFPFSPIQIILLELFMDLGASASFVAEPPEPSIDTRPPRDPHTPFLNRGLVTWIVAGGIALLAAVFVPYWYTLFRGEPVVVAQTTAFSAWLIGHVLLAFVSRSTTDPLYRVGLLSNRVMLLWGAGATIFLALALTVPAVGGRLGLTSIGIGYVGLVVGVPLVSMGVYEVVKVWRAGARHSDIPWPFHPE
ncbi:cation-translocating P-type ATPase [Methanoculleus sp.]|uniref:cation-translocating P-type ATPase n=1 Tax=Methanoculleus sp. TaxID=90427 RepID=UPI002FC9E0CC